MQISLPNFALFTAKSPSVTQRWFSQENAFKKSKNQVLMKAKFEFKVFKKYTIAYG